MTFFDDRLVITAKLTIAGKAFEIPPGNVKSLALHAMPYGFNGDISFVVFNENQTDPLFTPFTKNDLIEIALEVKAYDEGTSETITPMKFSGLVTSRSFKEQTLTNVMKTQDYMVHRQYRLQFADPAKVLWTQHYPCDLLVDSDLKTLINAHKPANVTLDITWPLMDVKCPVLSLSLGAPGNKASFYDYLWWQVDTRNGVLSYDAPTNKYSLIAAKSTTGTAVHLDPLEIEGIVVEYPEVHRYQPKVLNAYSEKPENTAVANTLAVTPIRHDYIDRYPIAADMTDRVSLETARLKQHLHHVRVDYKAFHFTAMAPGTLVDFKGSAAWNKSLFVQANTYRVKEWHLSAKALSGDDLMQDLNNDNAAYSIELNHLLENSTDTCVAIPPYTTPVYPFYVEGKVVSETGEDTDMTYQFYTDDTTSINYYKVAIPLWTSKNVRTAYEPHLDTGQFYFPPYKHQRVLIALGWNSATITAHLDWGAGTALPLDSQGNQLVMGKSSTSQNIVKHSYVDSKPKLEIQRTQDKDTELMQFSDGYIILQTMQTEEEG
jgi:hypothetical protein